MTAGTVYIKELSAPKGYKLDTTVHSLKVEAGKTVVLNVSNVPKVTEILVDLFKIDMETGKATAQGDAALAGAEITWNYYDGLYTKDYLPEKATRTWVTKTVAEKSSDGSIQYVTKLADAYKVSGDAFYTQNEKSVLPLGTINASLVIPREVFKSGILANASAIIGLHNHPSGNVKPSKEEKSGNL